MFSWSWKLTFPAKTLCPFIALDLQLQKIISEAAESFHRFHILCRNFTLWIYMIVLGSSNSLTDFFVGLWYFNSIWEKIGQHSKTWKKDIFKLTVKSDRRPRLISGFIFFSILGLEEVSGDSSGGECSGFTVTNAPMPTNVKTKRFCSRDPGLSSPPVCPVYENRQSTGNWHH